MTKTHQKLSARFSPDARRCQIVKHVQHRTAIYKFHPSSCLLRVVRFLTVQHSTGTVCRQLFPELVDHLFDSDRSFSYPVSIVLMFNPPVRRTRSLLFELKCVHLISLFILSGVFMYVCMDVCVCSACVIRPQGYRMMCDRIGY